MASNALPQLLNTVKRRRFAAVRSVIALMLREMGATYGRSPGGYIWAVAEPAAGIGLLAVIFALGFETPPLGGNFVLFYASGMVPFVFYADLSGKTATALLYSKPLLVYPSVTLIDALLARFLLNLLTQIMVAYIIFLGIFLFMETRVIPDWGTIVTAFALTAWLALGVGCLNAFLFTRFGVWQQVWSVVMRPMFIVSCIIFLPETIPQPYRDYLLFNPLVHLVGLMRRGIYNNYDADYVSVLYVVLFGAIALVVGLFLVVRGNRDLLQV